MYAPIWCLINNLVFVAPAGRRRWLASFRPQGEKEGESDD
jgi:hypothetical protein